MIPKNQEGKKVLIKMCAYLKSTNKDDAVFEVVVIGYTVKDADRKGLFDGSNVMYKMENFPLIVEEDAHWGTLLARVGWWLVNHHSLSSPCQGLDSAALGVLLTSGRSESFLTYIQTGKHQSPLSGAPVDHSLAKRNSVVAHDTLKQLILK